MDLLAGKRVLVTGGSGFLGRQVVARLAGHDVAEVIAPNSADGDLRERDAIRKCPPTRVPTSLSTSLPWLAASAPTWRRQGRSSTTTP